MKLRATGSRRSQRNSDERVKTVTRTLFKMIQRVLEASDATQGPENVQSRLSPPRTKIIPVKVVPMLA